MSKHDQPTDRMIIITYYVDNRRLACTKVIRSKYARLAAMRVFDNMSMNFYGADVCVVYDDEYGQHHVTFVRHKDGRIETQYDRDQTDPRFAETGSFKLKQTKTIEARLKRKVKR